MAKLTTIKIIQRVLSAIDSDNVSTIGETVESEQVKDLLDTVYDELIDDYPWDHLRSMSTIELTSTPNKMKLPNNVMQIDSIRYNKKDVPYISPSDMTKKLDSRDTTHSNVDNLGAYSDREPTCWTSYDDEYVVFDAYNGSLVSSYTNCSVIKKPVLLSNDSDIPDLPERLHVVLLNALMEAAFRIMKGDEQTALIYRRKYLVGLGKAKRWAKRVNEQYSTFGDDYARKN